MGRCNNRRTQQAAQSLRNTPARARFSAPPPHLRRQGRGRTGGGGGGRNSQQQQSNNVNRTNNNKASVIAKISQRVQAGSSSSSSSFNHDAAATAATTTHSPLHRQNHYSLHGVDLSQLEQLTLSESSLQIIDKLLQDLGVITKEEEVKYDDSLYLSSNDDDEEEERLEEQKEHEYSNNNDDLLLLQQSDLDSDVDGVVDAGGNQNTRSGRSTTKRTATAAAAAAAAAAATALPHEEYDEQDDGDDDDYLLPETSMTTMVGVNNIADDTEWFDHQNEELDAITTTNNKDAASTDIVKKWQSDPVFYHLTQKLSFPPIDAARACQAVENWPTAAAVASDTKTSPHQQQASRLVHVMDWMCLHLSEDDLKQGFQRNPDFQPSSGNKQNSSSLTTSKNSILLAGTGRTKPIPHPSISVAVKLTEDREWSRMTRLEERVVGFLPLGFLHGEILKVLQQESEDPDDNDLATAVQNSKILRRLLTVLEEEVLSSETVEDENSTVINEEDMQVERNMEKEALLGIYDTEFEAQEDDGSGFGQYKISMNFECCPENDTELFVFLRPNYPGTEYPLFLIHNPSLPWPFLRQMNSEIVTLVREIGIGVPLVFEVTSHVTETLPERLNEFHKVERAKAFERTQLHLRREAGHSIEDNSFLNYDDHVKIGRRQRARAKAAEVAFESGEEAQQKEEERKRQQEKRLEKIRDESRYVRQSMADRVMEKREIEKHKECIRKAGRSAMNAAFNQGASADEARKAARKAEATYRKDHGLIEPDNEETLFKDESKPAGEVGTLEQKQQTLREGKVTPVPEGATPTTAAFMERLRNMYTAAAKEKQQVTLCDPNDAGERKDNERNLPQPVPPLTGEFCEMAEDIIAVQDEQPWLVSREARVPNKAHQAASSRVQNGEYRQNEINQQLKKRFNLKGYLESSTASAQKRQTTQKWDEIQEQRRRLPAYSMREDIAKAIRENQITLIRGETGCGYVKKGSNRRMIVKMHLSYSRCFECHAEKQRNVPNWCLET